MKNKIKIKTIAIAVLILALLLITIIWNRDKENEDTVQTGEKETQEEIKTEPKIENDEASSRGTGALYISPTKEEFDEIMAFDRIMDEDSIETEDFTVYYDYGEDLIVVDFSDRENENNMDLFETWKEKGGYDIIDDEYWKINL